jgi:hypothetical protein
MSWIGIIHWIMSNSTIDPQKLIIFTTLSPQKHLDLKLDPVTTYICDKVGHVKVDQVGRIKDLIAHESSQPRVVYKMGLRP